MNIPLKFSIQGRNFKQELNRTWTVVSVNKHNLAAIYCNGLSEWQSNHEKRRYVEHLYEKTSGGGGAKHDAFRPIGRETAIVIRVKVGEEVRDRIIAGIAECVNGETGPRNELGVGECGGNWRERESGRAGSGLVGKGG
jgi:hypothetical protein